MEPIITHIRISACPDVVRAKVSTLPISPHLFVTANLSQKKLLDFSSLASSKPTFIHSITILDESKKPFELAPGDKLRCVLGGRILHATVATNTSSSFSWTGTIMGVLHGDHRFRFESSEDDERATDFFHEERFTGPLSWIMDDTFLARKIGQRASLVKSYEGFNADFKQLVESTDRASFV